jgi:hypothetical protein
MRIRFIVSAILGLVAVIVSAAPAPPALSADRDFDAGVGRVNDGVLSRDGRFLAVAGVQGYSLWDAQAGTAIRRGLAESPIRRVAFDPQGNLLAAGGEDGRVTIVDLRTGTSREAARHGKPVTAVAFRNDGRVGASGDAEGNITVWDAASGPIGQLSEGGSKKDIVVLAFANPNLLSASKDLRVVTWDVDGKRPIRRGTLQSDVRGRTVVPSAVAVDPSGERLIVAAQIVTEPRGGFVANRAGPARPEDLRRDNVLIPYNVSSGISGDPVKTNEFQAEHAALGPGACFAFFTSYYRNQSRLHIWGLVEQGDDLTRLEIPEKAAAIAVAPGGNLALAVGESGRVRTWRVSGATPSDCDLYTKKNTVPAGPIISLGPERDPLIKAGNKVRLAILRYDVTGVEAGLGEAVAEMVAGQLSNSPLVTVVERSAINQIMKELELQNSGLTAADAVKIGKGLNARKALFGSVRRFGESTYVISTRAVDIETQQVEGAREVTCESCKEKDLPRAVAALRRVIVP